jgi:hypothetical protein
MLGIYSNVCSTESLVHHLPLVHRYPELATVEYSLWTELWVIWLEKSCYNSVNASFGTYICYQLQTSGFYGGYFCFCLEKTLPCWESSPKIKVADQRPCRYTDCVSPTENFSLNIITSLILVFNIGVFSIVKWPTFKVTCTTSPCESRKFLSRCRAHVNRDMFFLRKNAQLHLRHRNGEKCRTGN